MSKILIEESQIKEWTEAINQSTAEYKGLALNVWVIVGH